MKKFVALILSALMMASVAAGCSRPADTESKAEGGKEAASDVNVGVCIYKFDDTFMTGVRNNMDAQAKTIGAKLDIVDSQNKQPTQNEQVDTFITKGVNALAVNPVDRTAAGPAC